MNKIKQAIRESRLLRIKDDEGNVRVVEPYALHMGKSQVLVHCFQVNGYSQSGGTGWRNIPLLDIQFAVVLEQFEPRKEFNSSKLNLI